jgi:YbbR domain-containing protein
MTHKSSQLWQQFKRDKWLLLLCFILAFLAWQGIKRNIGFTMTVSNVVVEVDAPDGWAVWDQSVHKVNILFRGSREDIRDLNNEQLRVVIPVPKPERDREMKVTLLSDSKLLKNPTSAKVVRFNPAEILFKLDQESERLLPVKAAFNGALSEGLEIEQVVCTPATVRVTGAKQVLDEMDTIQTQPIELKGRQGSFKESTPVSLPETGRFRADPEWVTVSLVLEMRSSEELFEKVPVRVLCAPGERRKIDIQPQTINVTVRGQQQRIEQVRSADMFAYVSCMELGESTGYDLPVVVDLPSGLQLIKTDPAVVHVQIGNVN